MAAANGENCKSQLLPQTGGHDKHSSADPSHVESTTYPHGDQSKHEEDPTIPTQSTASVPQRKKWVEAEMSRLKSEIVFLEDQLKREQAQSRNDIADAGARIWELSSSNTKLQGRLNNVEAEKSNLESSKCELEYRLEKAGAEMCHLTDDTRKLTNVLKVMDDEIKHLRSSNKRLEAVELALKSDLGNLRNDLGNLEAAYSKISDSGSYHENTATPTDASEAFNRLSQAVDSFSKQLRKFLSGHPDKMEELRRSYGDVIFLQSSLSPVLILKAEVMNILFKGFENESFNLDGGYCAYPDPVKRQKEFFALFLDFRNNKRGPGYGIKGEQDDQFVKYHRRSKSRVWHLFGLESSEDGLKSLELAFMKAALSVWAIHLLSFSFEPPASLFRIQNGSEFDRGYMVTPAFLEFDEDLLEKVEFMLTPGLRVDKFQTIKSEIYPVHVVHVQR